MGSSVASSTPAKISPHTGDNSSLSGNPVGEEKQRNTMHVYAKKSNGDGIFDHSTNLPSQTPAVTGKPSLKGHSEAPATPQLLASTTTSTTTTTTSTTSSPTSSPSSLASNAGTATSISPQSNGIAGSSSGDANPDLATPPDANQTNESQRKKHPSVPISQIDFKKISGQIKEVRQDVEEINAKLLKILEELEGYVSDNPDLSDQVLKIQDSLKQSMEANEIAKQHLKTAERQKDVIDKLLKKSSNGSNPSTDSEEVKSEEDGKNKTKPQAFPNGLFGSSTKVSKVIKKKEEDEEVNLAIPANKRPSSTSTEKS
jgi:hypothetical protein